MANHAAKDREPLKQHRLPSASEGLADRKEKFAALLKFVGKRNGWLVSVPGAFNVVMETLPDSTLPAELRELGYDPVLLCDGERILPCGITEHVPLTAGSSITRAVQHAGVVETRKWSFSL